MTFKTFFIIALCFLLTTVTETWAQEAFLPITDAADKVYCSLPTEYEEVNHTCRRQLQAITDELARFAGTGLGTFTTAPIVCRDGRNLINAMTCPGRRLIWVGLEAWARLEQRKASLAFIIGHEISHTYHEDPKTLITSAWNNYERQLLEDMNSSQLLEIACDRGAADLLLQAGYKPWEIVDAARFIAFQSEPRGYQPASSSHPADEDRITLLNYYLSGK